MLSTFSEHRLIKPCLEWSLTGDKKSTGKFKAGHLQEKVFYELEAPTLVISVGKFRCLDMGGCLRELVAPEGSNVVILIQVLTLM